MEKNYTLGLDMGITSVGWAAIDQEKGELIDFGVRMFDKAEEAKTARTYRSARRTLRRKKWRKQQFLKACGDFGLVNIKKDKYNSIESIDGFALKEYLNYYSKYKGLSVPKTETVYHLRQRALKEKISTRELILCIYNILQARGHFLLENIDFTREAMSFNTFKENFYELIENNNLCELKDKRKFEDEVLNNIYNSEFNSQDIKIVFKENDYALNSDEEQLIAICKLLCGYKADINLLINRESDEKKSVNIDDIKKEDIRHDIEEKLIILYDIILISKNLSDGCKYICDVDVKNFNLFKSIASNKKLSKEDKIKSLEFFINNSKSSSKEKLAENSDYNWFGRSIKNISHSYPNGMYVKEATDILKKQKEYNNKITDAFIEVVSTIVSARIPYYIGPLGKNAKNAWTDKNIDYKYSYDYSRDAKIEFESIKRWKERMISHCTYLPEEYALPKGSFIGEIFSIINELNNYEAKDLDGNDYYLTRKDKFIIFNELFLVKKDVTFKDIIDCINISSFGNKKRTMSKFNNSLSLYLNISKIIPELKLDSIEEIFKNKNKIDLLEEIILNINLFDEEKSKLNYFEDKSNKDKYKITDDQCKALSKLKSSNFYSISYKFIMNEHLDDKGNTMMDLLFEDNKDNQKNNQMVIIQNACDKYGKDYSSNKYENIIANNNNELNFDVIMNNGKAIMPISRPVVRSLNETIKIYKAVLETYGVPEKVVIETASGEDSIKDFTENSGVPMKRFKTTKTLYDYLKKQIKENKGDSILSGNLEDWEEIESFYKTNESKINLYIRQNGIDLLTGKKISLSNLEDYEIDHILPRGFGDDSMDDKMLTSKKANAKKGDRLPIEFLESPDAKTFTTMTVGHYCDIVYTLFSLKLISDKKKERLLLKNQDDAEIFINQNLVDTRYIIREFRSILNAYNKIKKYKTSIINLRGSFTSVFRKQFGIVKNRDLGVQHHAYDAATICIVDKVLNEYYPKYDKHGGMKSYHAFIEKLEENNKNKDDQTSKDKLRSIISFAFYKAYGQDIKNSKLLKQLKEQTPLLSYKVEKNYQSKLFDATLYKPEKDDKSVLSILGVNNNERKFESVNCVAVDFYKIGGIHYAIHIPLAILNSKGEINKNQYLKLIIDHYNANKLIGSDGTLQTKAFRFRAFKNDLIFDSYTNEPLLFNIGSIANKKLEVKYTNIFPYENIGGLFCSSLMNEIIKKFHLKTINNKDGIEFSELNKKDVINYLCDEFNIIANKERHFKSLFDETIDIDNLKTFCMKISYLSIYAEKPYNIPKIMGRLMPIANNNEIKKDNNAEWIKVKYHPLGVRFFNNDKGTLIIKGPKNRDNAFNIIKREEFSWKVSKM